MTVEVKLFATFRDDNFKKKTIEMPDGCTVAEILKDLKIEFDQIGILLVNGLRAGMEQVLEENDVLAVFPAIGGG